MTLKFRIKADFDDLEMTSKGKTICPLCGVAGWGAFWWSQHRVKPHSECVCGKVVTTQGLTRHQRANKCLEFTQ